MYIRKFNQTSPPHFMSLHLNICICSRRVIKHSHLQNYITLTFTLFFSYIWFKYRNICSHLQIQPYHQRSFNERHHQSSTTIVSSGGYNIHNNSSTPATIIPTGNQFIRGHTYRNSDTSELSEKNYHISSASMNSRHFESLMTSSHHVTSSAYDKIFQ